MDPIVHRAFYDAVETGASEASGRAASRPASGSREIAPGEDRGGGERTGGLVAGALNDERLVREAYERVKGELAALEPGELEPVNVDVPSAVATILGVLPELERLRPRIDRELPAFDLTALDKLEDYALALSFAQTSWLTTVRPEYGVQALAGEAAALRRRLSAEARVLSLHGLVDEQRLARLAGGRGQRQIAQDLQILSHVLEDAWPEIRGRLVTTAQDLERAYQLSARLMRVLGLRAQKPAERAAAREARRRAFTLAVRTYEAARRAVDYLCADEPGWRSPLPSLRANRGRRKRSSPPAEGRAGGVPEA